MAWNYEAKTPHGHMAVRRFRVFSRCVKDFGRIRGIRTESSRAIQRYDLNVVQTLVIFYAALGILGVFLGDVLMMVVDPRITLTGKEEAR